MIIFFTLIVVLSTILYLYFKQCYTFWDKKCLPYLKPKFPFGNFNSPLNPVAPAIQFCRFYEEFKRRGEKHGGVYVFCEPVYMPVDPEFVKNVLVKDFHHFLDRGIYYNEKDQPIMANLFFIEGTRWKNLRNKLTSTFTSGKMKMMFQTMLNCTLPLKDKVDECSLANESLDVKEILARFTTDVIGSCAFGIECDSFKNPNSEFRSYGRRVFAENIIKNLKGVLQFVFPNLSRKLGFLVIDKDVEDFFTKIVLETYEYRKTNNIKRNDFMQLLIDLKDKEGNPEEKMHALTTNELIAQAFLFFIAGFDTSATTLTFCLYELAQNLNIQTKLRNEIAMVIANHDGEVSYDAVTSMKYLQQVIEETMRKYPPVSLLNRICTEEYKVPHTDVTLSVGTQVGISAMGLHMDPEYYSKPEKFDPERFSDENRGKIRSGTYMPFGDGPRICIGLRFGLMQVKVGLISLLKHFEFTLNSKTKVPIDFELGFILTPKGGVWLNSRSITS